MNLILIISHCTCYCISIVFCIYVISVPPGGSLHAFFNEDENENEDENNLEVIILYNNPNDIPSDMRKVNFDTTLIASSKSLSACAKVDAFKSVIFYTVSSKNKNVLLKYKGEGQVVPRLGNSIKRVGFIGAMQGHRTAEDRVDYATNVKVIDVVFSVTS